jgi:hypothetical protein
MKLINIFSILLTLSSLSTSYAMVEKAPITSKCSNRSLDLREAAIYLKYCCGNLGMLAPSLEINNIINGLEAIATTILNMSGLQLHANLTISDCRVSDHARLGLIIEWLQQAIQLTAGETALVIQLQEYIPRLQTLRLAQSISL